MTLEQLDVLLDGIRQMASDDATAHQLEDVMHRSVLRAIADGSGNASELAARALTSSEIEFERWYE